MALVNSDYKFIFVDVGTNGRISDGGIYGSSKLNQKIINNTLNIPGPCPLPNRELPVPFVIVADDAFPLKEFIMKPYPRQDLWDNSKRIFNYRLSRARRTVENAFGILAARFRIFH